MDADKSKLYEACNAMLIVCDILRHDYWSGATVTYMHDGLVLLWLPAHLSGTSIVDITAGLRQV